MSGCVTVMLSALLAASAATPAGDPAACAAIDAPQARLDCYDAIFAPSRRTKGDRAVARFGLSGLDRNRQADLLGLPPTPDRITATVTAIKTARDGRRLLTLDNGQRWRLPPETTADRLRVGDAVELRDAALSAHFLVTPDGVRVRARRVQ